MSARLILGSSSPRRLDILNQIGMPPDVVVGADIDETPLKGELPHIYCKRIAVEKNAALATQYPNDYIVTADTTCGVGRRILMKADDRAHAERMIRLLSGRNHRIITAVCVRAPDGRLSTRVNETRLKIKHLSDAEITHFLDSKEWEGRAGAYHFTGIFARYIQKIIGSSSAILGLPAYETANMLTGLGYKGK
ncbi:MAG TPA: nucleoside triphosphate pyrophosphatase [Alphaproteobacteria bacterium]